MIARALKLVGNVRGLAVVAILAAFVALGIIAARGGSTDDAMFAGEARVGFTTFINPGGVYQAQNVFANNTRQIVAVIQVPRARIGMKVTGRWYRSGLTANQAITQPGGSEFDHSGFTMNSDLIDQDTGVGGGAITLTIFESLPPDAYMFRLFIDGKLAKEAPFVLRAPPG